MKESRIVRNEPVDRSENPLSKVEKLTSMAFCAQGVVRGG